VATAAKWTGPPIVVRDPDDASIIGEVPCALLTEVESALERGSRAARSAPPPAHERARLLRDVADRVAAEHEEHALLIAREGVKTIREARHEVSRAIETLRLSAEEAKRIGGSVIPFDQVPSGEGRIGWWAYRPAGLIVAITPYNDPLNLVAHKLGPAYAAGCPIILKPHPQTPFSAMRLVEHFYESGAAADRIQIINGGAEVGAALVGDNRPRVVSFTGGREAGDRIARRAGFKQLVFELGGVGIVGVAPDADLDRAAAAISNGAFWAAGQNCVRAQRIIAAGAIVEDLTERLVEKAAEIRLGPKVDDTTDMGPLVSRELGASLMRRVQTILRAGGSVLAGAECDGTHMRPTWIGGLQVGHPLLCHELFGPVSTIETARDDADLIDEIGAGADAIHAAIFTRSIANATSAFQRCNAAALLVNDSTDFRIDAMPFGGVGAAGLGREGVADATRTLSEKKMMIIAGC
jgi:glyceraldehyde-3-phosphate dehydrogenase (NADP+)